VTQMQRKKHPVSTQQELALDVAEPQSTPFLRWVGGKRLLTRRLLSLLPNDWRTRLYHEPFVGAGNLFFAMAPKEAILSDANEHLIRCYEYVRDEPALVARYLLRHASQDSSRYYYATRNAYNRGAFSAAQAARFIYLNKACFNGIFRVNRAGAFNVPYAHQYRTPDIPSGRVLDAASGVLRHANLRVMTFEHAFNDVTGNSFVYLDPPYPPLNGTSRFTEYTASGFGTKQQSALADIVCQLDAAGCKFMMTNADTNLIRRLYTKWHFIDIQVTRHVSCKAVRHQVSEVVIRNY